MVIIMKDCLCKFVDEFQMKHQWDMLTEENAALLREVYPNLTPEIPEPPQQ
jgi:hypothetical protein